MASITINSQGGDAAAADLAKPHKEAAKLRQEFNLTEKDAKRLAATQKRIMRELETAQEKYNRKVRDARKAFAGHAQEREMVARAEKKYREEMVATTDASKEAFDSKLLVAWGAGIGVVTGAVSKLYSTLVSIREEQEAAADALNSTLGSAGNLVQLAGADSKKRDRLFAASDQTFSEGFVRSREDADKLIFELGVGWPA